MAYDSTFTPQVGGQTILVGTAVVQFPAFGPNQVQATSYRVRCLATGYLAFAVDVAGNATPPMTAAAPTAGAGVVNTIGMTLGGVETFQFPQNAWFLSSVAGGFEITSGEGV